MISAEIFTREEFCPFCDKAKKLLQSINMDYVEHKIGRDLTRDDFVKMFSYLPRHTVPQIMINGRHIGGYEELVQWKEETYGGYGEQSI